MREKKFTPGPWRSEYGPFIFSEKEPVCAAFKKDDAHLIAAAPLLLEALEEMVRLESKRIEDLHPREWRKWIDEMEEAEKSAKSAIAAAYGEEGA